MYVSTLRAEAIAIARLLMPPYHTKLGRLIPLALAGKVFDN
jgi:hypothetical protein